MNSNFIKDEDRMFIKSIEIIQKYLSEQFNPHTKIIIDSSGAGIVEGVMLMVKNEGVNNEG